MPGRIPQSFINDLLQRVDIVDVIDARVPLRKAGKNHKACCPFHQEKTPSFSVNSERGFYKCFGCGVAGTALTFLMEHDRLEFVEAVEALARMAGVEVPREGGATPPKQDGRLYELLTEAARAYRRALKEHADAPVAVAYLKQRGVTGEVAQQFGIGFAPDAWSFIKGALPGDEERLVAAGLLVRQDKRQPYDRLRNRIVFPIRDTRGRVVGFGGRALPGAGEERGPKYLNSPETQVFHKARELYGLYEARQAGRGRLARLIVVEGYMDVVALAQHGVANAVATLGTAVGGAHFEKLYRNAPEVICCFDGDAAGRAAAWRALQAGLPTLREGRRLGFAFLPDGEDPDTYIRAAGKSGFDRHLAGAVAAEDYLVETLSAGLDLKSTGDQATLGDLAKPLLAQLPAGTRRQALLTRLARLVDVAPAALDAAAAVGAAEPSPHGGKSKAAASVEESPLGRRLLGHLMRNPTLLGRLDSGLAARLVGSPGDSLFLRVARRIGQEQEAEPAVVLAGFVSDPGYETLRNLAETPEVFEGAALEAEFAEGAMRYVEERSRSSRRRLERALREDSSIENLRRYWQARQEGEGATTAL